MSTPRFECRARGAGHVRPGPPYLCAHGVPGGAGRVRSRPGCGSPTRSRTRKPTDAHAPRALILGLDDWITVLSARRHRRQLRAEVAPRGHRRVHAARVLGSPGEVVEDRIESLLAAGHAWTSSSRSRPRSTTRASASACASNGPRRVPAAQHPDQPLCGIVQVLLPGALRRHYSFEGLIVATNKASYVAYRGPWEVERWARERCSIASPTSSASTRSTSGAATCSGGRVRPHADRGHARVHDDQPHARGSGRAAPTTHAARRSARVARERASRRDRLSARTSSRPPVPPTTPRTLGFTYEQRSLQRARVRVEIDGSATVFTSQQPHGQGHETTLAQLAADELGLPIPRCASCTATPTSSPSTSSPPVAAAPRRSRAARWSAPARAARGTRARGGRRPPRSVG